jgi:hypothetical protein
MLVTLSRSTGLSLGKHNGSKQRIGVEQLLIMPVSIFQNSLRLHFATTLTQIMVLSAAIRLSWVIATPARLSPRSWHMNWGTHSG